MARDARWPRIEELYHTALERAPSERSAFLRAACGEDDALRQEVESLLAEGAPDDFLGTSALEVAGREMAASRAALIGRRLGPYQIVSLLGTGGMGEVYRARDTKLERDVAIKVLPSAVAHDADRITRFTREARLLAALNHPHIAAIHGLEESEGISAIVLELVEGGTLADRIARGPMPPAEATVIAKQIIDGLEAAHEHGIIHRDLKPSNIKVRPDGTVKILDFGLAKALAPPPLEDTLPRHVSSVTHMGVVTGTPAYMSPEQAQGLRVDTRTDIWSFGCVFYEMLTGHQAFAGGNVSETLAAVIAAEPRWDTLPRDLSPGVRLFLMRCLSKDVKQRVTDIRTMRQALDGAFETGAAPPATTTTVARPTWQRVMPAAAVAVTLALVAALTMWSFTRTAVVAPLESKFSIQPRAGLFLNVAHILALSPGGTHIVYASEGSLWLRPLNALEPVVVRGTEASDPDTPFFSPDGQWVAFYARGQLKRASISGGPPVTIATSDRPFGASWGTDNLILYGQGPDGIWQVAATNGTPERVLAVADGEEAHSPQALPDGTVLFTVRPRGASSWSDAQIVVQARGSSERTVVVPRGRDARYLSTGHLIYAFGEDLLATTFDVGARRFTREPASLLQGVAHSFQPFNDATHFAVAGNGTLVYVPFRSPTRATLVWVARNGSEEPLPLEIPSISAARVSPDGTRIAYADGKEMFVSDSSRPAWTRINTGARNAAPLWTPKGTHVVFWSEHEGVPALFSTRADGTGGVDLLMTMKGVQLLAAGGWTSDGRLVFTYGMNPSPRLGLLDMNQVGRTEQPWRPLFDRSSAASTPSLSPRGDWIAYQSDDSGTCGVYIERLPDLTDKRLISGERGGRTPRWSHDGKELFYRRLDDNAMMSVSILTTPRLETGAPAVLFEDRGYVDFRSGTQRCGGGRAWDVAPDGRFLMVKPGSANSVVSDSIVVHLNWLEDVKRRMTNSR